MNKKLKKYLNPKTNKKYRYYDKNGKGLDNLMDWGKKTDKIKYKTVKQQYTWLGFLISTVWLGLDHSFQEDELPLIFETMVFNVKISGYSEYDSNRYTTKKEALIGHQRLYKEYSNPIFVFKVLYAQLKSHIKHTAIPNIKKFYKKEVDPYINKRNAILMGLLIAVGAYLQSWTIFIWFFIGLFFRLLMDKTK